MASESLPPLSQVIQLGPVIVTVQQLEFLACLLSSYVFSVIYYRKMLHSRWHKVKHFFLAAVSHVYVLVCFSVPILLNIYLPIVTTFVLTKRYRDKRWMPLAVFTAVLGHLSVAHLYRQFFEQDLSYHLIDQTAPLMILTIKLTSYAFDISDAYFSAVWERPRKSNRIRRSSVVSNASIGSPGGSSPGPSTRQSIALSEDEIYRERQLISLQRPATFLEFLGFAFLFPGFLAGPTITFYEYRCFVDGSYFDGVDAAKGALKGRRRRALKQFLISLVFLVIYAGFKDTINLTSTLTEDHISQPVWYRVLYLHVVNLVWRSKYYFAWILAEGSYIMIGLGYRRSSHPGGKPRWDRCENVNLKRVELAANFKQIISEWNVATNQWLYAYVYKRVANWLYPGRRPGFRANLATYVVSAFWHVTIIRAVFRPALIVVGILSGLLHFVRLCRIVYLPHKMYSNLYRHYLICVVIYKNITWPLNPNLKWWVLYLPNYILVDYMVAPFNLLTWTEGIRFLRVWKYWGHIVIFSGLVLMLTIQGRQKHHHHHHHVAH